MKNTLLLKAALTVVVFVGFAAFTPANAARAPRPPFVSGPPVPVSGL